MRIPAALTTLLLLGAAAFGDEPMTFSSLDTDNNGAIDEQESQSEPMLAEQFKEADTDQDGKLNQREYAFAMAKIRTETDPRQPS